MKKALVVLLCLVMSISLFGCGKEKAPEKSTPENTSSAEDFKKLDTSPLKLDESLKSETFTKVDGSYSVDYFVPDGSSYDSIANYDGNGKLISSKKFTYDESGKRKAAYEYDSESKFTGGTAYEYDGDTLMKIYYYDENGDLEYYESREYDENGELLRAPIISADGRVLAAGERTTAAEETK